MNKVKRTEHREGASKDLGDAIGDAGMTYAEVARAIGVDERRVRAWANPNIPETIHLAAIEQLPVAVLRSLQQRIADRVGISIVVLPTTEPPENCYSHLAELSRESGEVISTYADSASDGVVTAGEAAELDKCADKELVALGKVKLLCRYVFRERALGLKKAAPKNGAEEKVG